MLGTMIASGEVLEDFAEPSSFPVGISSDSVMVVVALVLLSTTDPSGISTTVVAAAVVVSVEVVVVSVACVVVVDALGAVVTVTCSDVREVVVSFDDVAGVAFLVEVAFAVVVDGASETFVVVADGVAFVVEVLVDKRGVEDGTTVDLSLIHISEPTRRPG